MQAEWKAARWCRQQRTGRGRREREKQGIQEGKRILRLPISLAREVNRPILHYLTYHEKKKKTRLTTLVKGQGTLWAL